MLSVFRQSFGRFRIASRISSSQHQAFRAEYTQGRATRMTRTLVPEIRSEFPCVDGTPTHVLKCGDFPADPDQGKKMLYLIIPGNPGVVGYYDKFMRELYRAHGGHIPVWGVAHAGHVILPDDVRKGNSDASKGTFSLQDQINHKISFIKNHVPADTQLILIGHSIGCYIILEILRRCPEVNVLKGIQLLPTVEHMKETPNGSRMLPFVLYFRWLACFVAFMLSFLPEVMKLWLLKLYFLGKKLDPGAVEASLNLFDPSVTNNSLFMASQEIIQVREPDLHCISQHLDRLIFYYGVNDGWAPVSFYQRMKNTFPQGDVHLCERGIQHAFVLEQSAEMAGMVAEWIEQATAAEGGRTLQTG
ncbi:PREDICTED: lipid droplet-associated hydrolase-like [Branchiostoma belcheri]|uniref:Lipid droplet-associated hydrolase n=1 Tax=Branchiostoma belcheri TaxID=7741 RepID=A0A6P4YSJ3_BRABE|nr:PREDICTED: lipid droplet-associated hydrolase-like [Branchiostoma belcheri]